MGLPHRLHLADLKAMDRARILPQAKLQAVAASGCGYFGDLSGTDELTPILLS
jgi:hypothetical protein